MKVLRFTLLVIHFMVIVLLWGTVLNSIIPPKVFPYANLLSLAFPFLMILNVALLLVWIVLRKKRALLFLVFTLFLFNPIRRWVNYSGEHAEKPNLKVVTANIHSDLAGMEKIHQTLKSYTPDIIIVQEYRDDLDIAGYPYYIKDYEIVALASKHKIIHHEKLTKTGNGNSFYADIDVNGRIIRVVNVYMNPFSFEKEKVKPVEDLEKNKGKVRYILKRLIPTFKIHQQEVDDIRTAIDDSPYPVILAGDFNAVPNSYEYYHLGKGLTDAFVAAGNGSGTSFHDYKFPIRLDYIFTSKEIKALTYRVDRSVKISDHFPVIAEFKLN